MNRVTYRVVFDGTTLWLNGVKKERKGMIPRYINIINAKYPGATEDKPWKGYLIDDQEIGALIPIPDWRET